MNSLAIAIIFFLGGVQNVKKNKHKRECIRAHRRIHRFRSHGALQHRLFYPSGRGKYIATTRSPRPGSTRRSRVHEDGRASSVQALECRIPTQRRYSFHLTRHGHIKVNGSHHVQASAGSERWRSSHRSVPPTSGVDLPSACRRMIARWILSPLNYG